jgi:spore germination cell wall hydrolase CwlJ-like protein
MSQLFRAASAAAFVFVCAGLTGVMGTTAWGAADTVEARQTTLLPEAIYDVAANEGETPVDYTILPEPVEQPEADRPARSSLTALVADRAGAAPRNAQEDCLAGAIYFESKGESLEGQLAVAKVIINRANSGRFASSLCGVVFQPGQFSFVHGGSMPAIAKSSRHWSNAVAIAQIARDELWQSAAPKALFFHARHVSPGWRLTRVAAIGNHIFYR